MDPREQCSVGGITGLQRFTEEHAEALEYDLITKAGCRLRDIGEQLSWSELRAFIAGLPPTGESALYRALHPGNWWWTPQLDFMAATLHAIQAGNWQRGGGKGPRPEPVRKPRDVKPGRGAPQTLEELAERKKALNDELERRRRRKVVS